MLQPTYLQAVGFELFSDLKPEPSPHMHSMWVTWIDRLKKYYEIPHSIFDVAEYRDSYLNFDNEKSNLEHKPLAKQNENESLYCLTHGEETFRFVSPAFK